MAEISRERPTLGPRGTDRDFEPVLSRPEVRKRGPEPGNAPGSHRPPRCHGAGKPQGSLALQSVRGRRRHTRNLRRSPDSRLRRRRSERVLLRPQLHGRLDGLDRRSWPPPESRLPIRRESTPSRRLGLPARSTTSSSRFRASRRSCSRRRGSRNSWTSLIPILFVPVSSDCGGRASRPAAAAGKTAPKTR